MQRQRGVELQGQRGVGLGRGYSTTLEEQPNLYRFQSQTVSLDYRCENCSAHYPKQTEADLKVFII